MTCYAFVLVPRFSLLALSSAVEALRAANVAANQPLYRWLLVSADPGPVESSSGLVMEAADLVSATQADVIAVCGGERSHDYGPGELLHWLGRQAARGCQMGALSDGSFVAAAAGLFDEAPSTIHWHCLDTYRERHPALDIRASVFELDHRRFSCAGGTAALDLMLTMIQKQHGQSLAATVADTYIHDRIREAGSTQRISSYFELLRHSRPLAEAVRLMETHVESPLRVGTIATRLNLSLRQLDRLFQRRLGTAPSVHYRNLRLARGRRLLLQSNLQVDALATATGFSSSAHFARCFRAVYGVSPRDCRRGSRGKPGSGPKPRI